MGFYVGWRLPKLYVGPSGETEIFALQARHQDQIEPISLSAGAHSPPDRRPLTALYEIVAASRFPDHRVDAAA